MGGGLALAFPPWDVWRVAIGAGVLTAFGVVTTVDYREWKSAGDETPGKSETEKSANPSEAEPWRTRRRPLSQLTDDELYDITIEVSKNLWKLVSESQPRAFGTNTRLADAAVASYTSLASVNVQALADELDRRGYGRPGLSLLARDAKSLDEIGAVTQNLRIASNQIPAVEPGTPAPAVKSSLAETLRLAKRCTKESKAIYTFLNKQAMRPDEPKVVAEYRQKFDAKVFNLCLDLITAGLSDTERLKLAMTPPTSTSDIQWIARALSIVGEGFGPSLERAVQRERPLSGTTMVKAIRTNADRFPSIETVVDSFGNEPERLAADSLLAVTGHELTLGDQVTFHMELSDPNRDDSIVSIIPPGSGAHATNVTITTDGVMAWNVREEDISDPAWVFIFVTSQREQHRSARGFDDSVAFLYRVVSRAGEVVVEGA